MSARRSSWALVAIAAVFAMHGLQCVSHDFHAHAGHAAGAMVTPTPAAAAEAPDGPTAAGAPDIPGHPEPASAPPRAPGDPSAPLPVDVWVACLAVLGVVVLLAATLTRARPLARGPSSWAPLPRWVSTSALPRPPDLFVLCVLRN